MPEPSQPPQFFSYKHMNNNIDHNFNIASYYFNHLPFPDISTWNTAGESINQKIKPLGQNKQHIRTIEITCKMVNECKENKYITQEINY